MKWWKFELAVIAVLGCACPVLAQLDGNGLNSVELKGSLLGMHGYQLKVKGDDQQDYAVILDQASGTFRYEGKASPQFLSSGMMVRFTAQFDQAGNPQAALKQIEIFTPRKDRLMMEEELRAQTAGIYPVIAEAQQDGSDPAPAPNADGNPSQLQNKAKARRDKAGRQPGKQAQPQDNPLKGLTAGSVQEFRVVGRIANMQGDKIQVLAGLQSLILQLDSEIQIHVAGSDATFCAAGDSVLVHGLSRAAQPNLIKAQSIVVTGAEPLSLPEKKIGGKPDAKKAKANSGPDKSPARSQPQQASKIRK
ncbi:MAG TPA: hypothetical protein DCF63_17885 [Planctomycetaceae bacterium]|nr:hypothetical protein [Planctomycetaceae bacterium]